MSQLKIYINQLSGEKIIQNVTSQTKIAEIKQNISELKKVTLPSIMLKFKGKDLNDQSTVAESNIQFGDSLTLIIKAQPTLQKTQSNKTQNDEAQIQELISFGFSKQEIEKAIQKANGDYLQAFCILQQKNQQQNLIQEEIPLEIPKEKMRYKVLLQNSIVNELRSRVANEFEWKNTINVVQQLNPKLSQLIEENQDEFRHLYIEKFEKNVEFLDQNDVENLSQLKQFKTHLSDQFLLDTYIKNQRDMYNTIQELDN